MTRFDYLRPLKLGLITLYYRSLQGLAIHSHAFNKTSDLLHLLRMHIIEVRSELEPWDGELPEVGKYHAQVESTGVQVPLDVQFL